MSSRCDSDKYACLPDSENIELIVVGGCHVIGYPFDSTKSFSSRLAELLRCKSPAVVLRTVPYVKLTDVEKLMNEIATANDGRTKTSVLVLQLGNFEFTAYIERLLPAWITKHGVARIESAVDQRVGGEAVSTYRSKAFVYFVTKALLKLPIYWANVCLRGADRKHEKDLASLMARLPKTLSTIVMSPLPCLDFSSQLMRRRARRMFRAVALHESLLFYDPYEARPDDGSVSSWKYYFDSIHLNVRGHQRIADDLYNIILVTLCSKKKKDVRLCDGPAPEQP